MLEKPLPPSAIAVLKDVNPLFNKFIEEDLSEAKMYDKLTPDQRNPCVTFCSRTKKPLLILLSL